VEQNGAPNGSGGGLCLQCVQKLCQTLKEGLAHQKEPYCVAKHPEKKDTSLSLKNATPGVRAGIKAGRSWKVSWTMGAKWSFSDWGSGIVEAGLETCLQVGAGQRGVPG